MVKYHWFNTRYNGTWFTFDIVFSNCSVSWLVVLLTTSERIVSIRNHRSSRSAERDRKKWSAIDLWSNVQELIHVETSNEEMIECVVDLLWERREMLEDYFPILLASTSPLRFETPPILLNTHTPNLDEHPHFRLDRSLEIAGSQKEVKPVPITIHWSAK